ncbi:LOW QUALITY PROTEIN: UDP-glucuronosyltransferase 2C1-like [Diadema antillarum]|uniref:LOW QUALITY PROTEIN: UDP-glucuronosyltransferase 2C1-like n=1 Tax=Diadema antillarum TaxID=105358 RepID=UPI003A884762
MAGSTLWNSYLKTIGICIIFSFAGFGASPLPTEGAKILLSMTSIINTPSQHIVISAITEPLVERGHSVTLLAPMNKITKGLTDAAVTDKKFFASPRSRKELEEIVASFSSLASLSGLGPFGAMKILREKVSLLGEGCVTLFSDTDTLDVLKKEKYDIIITMPIGGCDFLLGQYLDVPYVAISPVRRTIVVTEDHFGIPIPSSYVPFTLFLGFTDQMSFRERLVNIFSRYVVMPTMEYIATYPVQRIKREFNIRPDLSLRQLTAESKLWLVCSNFAFEFAQPTAPNWIPIGGITAKPAKPLPKDLNDFVEGSGDHGIIVFTLGSSVTSLDNEILVESIAKVFSELPQRVLWRYKGAKPRNLGNNTLISDWLPQNDLLGHPKTRMLIYHGGASGVYEATSHGVPLLLMPLVADQMANAARVESKGLGFAVDKNTITEEEFRVAVNEILSNPKYKTNMARAAAIMKDQPVPPRDAVVFWVEHVLKFGGDHLRLRAADLNFIQHNSLDVLAFLLVILLLEIYIIKWIVCRCCCSRSKKTTKPKSD